MQDVREQDDIRSKGQVFLEEISGMCVNAIAQIRFGDPFTSSHQRRLAIEDRGSQRWILATSLDAVCAGRATHIEQMCVTPKIKYLEYCFRSKDAEAVHGRGEISLRFRIAGNLIEGVSRPDLRLIRSNSFGQAAPGLVQMTMDHRDVIAKIIMLALHQKFFGGRGVVVAPVTLLQQAQSRAGAQQHARRTN